MSYDFNLSYEFYLYLEGGGGGGGLEVWHLLLLGTFKGNVYK